MVQFNFSERTIKAKVVYYGPPQSGKTTNLEQIHRITDPDSANRLISLSRIVAMSFCEPRSWTRVLSS